MCTPTRMTAETAAGAPAATMPRIGDKAPDFTAVTTQGQIVFSKWQGDSWALLFSHPADFTPVCSTELCELARRQEEFSERRVKLIGLSVDGIHSHLAWRENLREIMDVQIYYPLNVGRNVDEIVRLIDALQTADQRGVACPVNWRTGQKVIVPPPKTEQEVAERLAADYERLDFYLCKTDGH